MEIIAARHLFPMIRKLILLVKKGSASGSSRRQSLLRQTRKTRFTQSLWRYIVITMLFVIFSLPFQPLQQQRRCRRLAKRREKEGIDRLCLFGAFSIDRIDAVRAVRKHWAGPMSLAVAVESAEEHRRVLKLSAETCITVTALETTYFQREARYPVNRLRNLAAMRCSGDFLLLHDIDFTVHPTLSAATVRNVDSFFKNATEPTVLVLPAFSLKGKNVPWDLLKTKQNLLHAIDIGLVSPFNMDHFPRMHNDLNGFYPGHAPTDYARWSIADAPYAVRKWNENFPYYYEPYVIIERKRMLKLDESFVHYGFNKVSFLHELAASGFEFYVHPDLFVVHTFSHKTELSISPESLGIMTCGEEQSRKFYKASIGHSCIGYFLRRMQCAYGFGIDALSFTTARPAKLTTDMFTDVAKVPCIDKCIYDTEEFLRKKEHAFTYTGGILELSFYYVPPERDPCHKAENMFPGY